MHGGSTPFTHARSRALREGELTAVCQQEHTCALVGACEAAVVGLPKDAKLAKLLLDFVTAHPEQVRPHRDRLERVAAASKTFLSKSITAKLKRLG